MTTLLFFAGAARADETSFPPFERFVDAARKGDLLFVKKWIRRGMDPNGLSQWSESALHAAASANQVDTVRYLIFSGAEVDARDFLGKTPLLLAVEKFSSHSVAVLCANGADLNSRDTLQETPLLAAIRGQNLFLTKKLLEEGARPNISDARSNSALHLAVEMNDPALVKSLLAYGADPSLVDSQGRTPLHLCALRSNAFADWVDSGMTVFWGILWGNSSGSNDARTEWEEGVSLKIAKFLLEAEASVDARDNKNQTPLAEATRRGRIDLVKLFLSRGADAIVWTEKNKFSTKTLEDELRTSAFDRIKSLFVRPMDSATPKPGTLVK